MTLQRIDEMSEPPVVGRFYLVPTCRYEYYRRTDLWPVIGPRHEDAEIFNFPHQHYHVDGRFLTARQRTYLNRWGRHGDDWVGTIGAAPLNVREEWSGKVRPHPPLTWERRRCSDARVSYPWGGQPAVKKLRAHHATDKLHCGDHGWICPHRGAHLGSVAPDAQGIITCPLHGLRWHADTGEAETMTPASGARGGR